MLADGVDDIFVEVPRVPDKTASNAVCVFESGEDRIRVRGVCVSLSKLCLSVLGTCMNVHDPSVVGSGQLLSHVGLELDNVAVWDLLGVD